MARGAMRTTLALCLTAVGPFLCGVETRGAELRGHGGAMRAIAVTADGQTAITGGFDAKAIIWPVRTGQAREVLFHDSQSATSARPFRGHGQTALFGGNQAASGN
ncbi:hypothetical protein LB566_09205 [Mesorhizobium sp. CA13]|uniref:hypothetical protein n=1 Tax=unclassified Mesorhizobium TaxID=325217 RepID=UPI001CCF412A|nr:MULTISPECIES: hypothetical protein [unclassified Mesorhizobium]MBZ9853976.1 hypothetical protein [Mesorhizobium sp. CA13]MCA0039442.1 hypothetical protein [Mesorhizobium sp. B292B1B]